MDIPTHRAQAMIEWGDAALRDGGAKSASQGKGLIALLRARLSNGTLTRRAMDHLYESGCGKLPRRGMAETAGRAVEAMREMRRRRRKACLGAGRRSAR